jgi:ABC-type phosphate transport system substrate-binding protein
VVGAIAVVLAGLVLVQARPTAAKTQDFVVIVQRSNPVTSVDNEFLRAVFLRKAVRWDSGEAIRPIDLPKGVVARDRFTRDVLGKTPAQLRNFWVQRIFSGTDGPPPEAASTAAAVAYVLANPGAVTYVPTNANIGDAKVITIR